MHHHVRTRALAGAGLALVLAGCGGGGTRGGALPAPATTTPGGTLTGSADARFVFTIPSAAKSSGAKRAPRYISAATQSIGVSVTPVAGGTAVSATIDVGSSNCATTGAGQTCTLVIAAPIGNDAFVITMYDTPGGGGHVLSTGTMTQNVQAHVANVFPLTLGGTVASLSFTIDKPYLPVVDGGTAGVDVVAKDAAGNQIVGGYSTPITVALPAGLTLGSGVTTVPDSSAAHLTVRYDGVSKTALGLTATSGTITGTGAIVPASHAKYYADPQAVAGSLMFKMVKGPDGALYYGYLGLVTSNTAAGTSPGAIGRVDPATGAITDVAINGINPIGLLFVGNDLYIAEQNSSSIGRIANAAAGGFSASNYSQVVLHNTSPGVIPNPSNHYDAPRMLAYASGKVYVTTYWGNEIAVFDPAAWAGASTPVTYVPVSFQKRALRPHGITTGADGNLYITDGTVTTNPYVSKLVPGATTTTSVSDPIAGINNGPDGAANEPASLRFIATGADGKLYITWGSYNNVPSAPALTRYDGASTFTALALPNGVSTQPDSIQPGSGTTLVFNDLATSAIGVYDTAASTFRQYPLNGLGSGGLGQSPDDVVDYGDGTYWFTNQTPLIAGAPIPQIGHLVLAQGWTVFPEGPVQIDGLGTQNSVLIGVGEAATSHDTFTVTSATPSVCSVAQPPGYANDYAVTGVSSGACRVTVTDQTNRTATVPIAVTANAVTISGHRRISR